MSSPPKWNAPAGAEVERVFTREQVEAELGAAIASAREAEREECARECEREAARLRRLSTAEDGFFVAMAEALEGAATTIRARGAAPEEPTT